MKQLKFSKDINRFYEYFIVYVYKYTHCVYVYYHIMTIYYGSIFSLPIQEKIFFLGMKLMQWLALRTHTYLREVPKHDAIFFNAASNKYEINVYLALKCNV